MIARSIIVLVVVLVLVVDLGDFLFFHARFSLGGSLFYEGIRHAPPLSKRRPMMNDEALLHDYAATRNANAKRE